MHVAPLSHVVFFIARDVAAFERRIGDGRGWLVQSSPRQETPIRGRAWGIPVRYCGFQGPYCPLAFVAAFIDEAFSVGMPEITAEEASFWRMVCWVKGGHGVLRPIPNLGRLSYQKFTEILENIEGWWRIHAPCLQGEDIMDCTVEVDELLAQASHAIKA